MSSMNHLGTLLASHVLLGDVKIQLLRDLLTVRLSIDLEEDIHFKQVTMSSIRSDLTSSQTDVDLHHQGSIWVQLTV